jgi:SpoIID/LytB domain protein
VTITPAGAPALTLVGATGNRYRGTIELRRTASGVRVINHVALEDYVSGIAEERGAGWPLEAMETLAIAARTLGSATMTWMDANHADGYDICPNDHCQVYMGYDGEEAVMREAAQATAGEIRAYGGRPIVAMYHGNGGGQTASYRELTDDGSDPYPYLQSIKYPYADPWHWQVTTTLHEMAAALTSAGNQVPAPLKYVVVVKRGESPRVKLVGLFSNARNGVGISGVAFSRALQLPSTWFYVHLPHRPPHSIEEGLLGLTESGRGGNPAVPSPRFPWSLALLAGALAAAAAAANLGVNGGAATVASAFSTLRPRIARTLTRRPSTADASISG